MSPAADQPESIRRDEKAMTWAISGADQKESDHEKTLGRIDAHEPGSARLDPIETFQRAASLLLPDCAAGAGVARRKAGGAARTIIPVLRFRCDHHQ